ncbi:MAG TPA: ArsC family reductase [Rubrivivax sp.]
MPAITTLYGVPNCDTVKRARQWLTANGVEYRFHDFKHQGVPAAPLARWLASAGRDRLVNRQGTTWRKLDEAVRARVVDDASATRLMQDQPSVIKRPVVEWADGRLTVGFDEAAWRLASKA